MIIYVPKSIKQQFCVSTREYQGSRYVSLRIFQEGKNGEWFPLKGSGITLPIYLTRDVVMALIKVVSRLEF